MAVRDEPGRDRPLESGVKIVGRDRQLNRLWQKAQLSRPQGEHRIRSLGKGPMEGWLMHEPAECANNRLNLFVRACRPAKSLERPPRRPALLLVDILQCVDELEVHIEGVRGTGVSAVSGVSFREGIDISHGLVGQRRARREAEPYVRCGHVVITIRLERRGTCSNYPPASIADSARCLGDGRSSLSTRPQRSSIKGCRSSSGDATTRSDTSGSEHRNLVNHRPIESGSSAGSSRPTATNGVIGEHGELKLVD